MGIQLWSGLYREIPKITPEKINRQQIQEVQQTKPVQEETFVKEKEEIPAVEDNRSRTADPNRISLTFNKEDTFDYIGSESGLADLDMQKAISDMKKDSILQEYQYFVGSAQNILNLEDGIVLPK